jgi:hypothetical protein
MGFWNLIANNWFICLQSAAIIGSLLFTGLSFRIDAKVRRASNLLIITEQHRGLWLHLLDRPELGRVLDATADLKQKPLTEGEELFVSLLILHLSSVYRVMCNSLVIEPEELRKDISSFFSLPIPASVWIKKKEFQNKDFVAFVENLGREA